MMGNPCICGRDLRGMPHAFGCPVRGDRCDDCGEAPAPAHYFLGNQRCVRCALKFDEAWRAERAEKHQNERIRLEIHASGVHTMGGVCPECCDHSDMEGTFCLDCDQDRTEDMMADAYDRAKDAKKYGDT